MIPGEICRFGIYNLPKKQIPHSVKASRVLHPLFCYIVQLTFELQIPWESPVGFTRCFFKSWQAGKHCWQTSGIGVGASHWHVLVFIRLMEEIRLTSWYGKYLIIFQGFIWVLYIPGGAGFRPSTVPPFHQPLVLDLFLNVPTHQLNGYFHGDKSYRYQKPRIPEQHKSQENRKLLLLQTGNVLGCTRRKHIHRKTLIHLGRLWTCLTFIPIWDPNRP